MKRRSEMKKLVITGLCLLLGGSIMADVFYLHANMPTNSSPNDKTLWFDDPVAGTSLQILGKPTLGNRFDLNGYEFRTATGTSHTFSGTLISRASPLAMMYANMWNLVGLDVDTGTLLLRPHQTNVTMNISNLTVGSSGYMDLRTLTGNNVVNLSVANFSGSGHVRFGITSYLNDTNGVWSLSVTDTTPEFTGTIDLTRGQLTFATSFVLGDATFAINSVQTNRVMLVNDVTFGNVTFGTNSLATGTYTAAQLNSTFGTTRFYGTGKITAGYFQPPLKLVITMN